MTKALAATLHEALHAIECGRIDEGVRLLRTLLSTSGHPAPPFIIAARERAPHGKER
jgi:hypothetical protein